MADTIHQNFDQWQASPIQGAIPALANPLHEVEESLKTALPWLENAYALMNSNGFDKSHHELYVAVCDAMTAVQEGCDRLTDGVDE